MLHGLRTAAVARLSVALVTAALSGAPRVVAMQAPVEGHRCLCRAHLTERECECAVCRRTALAAQASDEKVPPCHRAAARKALAEREQGGPSRSAPCVEGACGGAGGAALTPGGVEPFVIPAAKASAVAWRGERTWGASDVARERPLEPEIPPPRPA